MKLREILLSCLFTIFASIVFAQEQISITTYYPTPNGVYEKIKLEPTDDSTPGGACVTEGELYYDRSGQTVYVCSGAPTAWITSPGQLGGGSSYWAAAPSNANDIYNTNSGNVGIGTNNPLAKLQVNGSLYHYSANGGASFFGGGGGNANVALRSTLTGLAMRLESAFSSGLGRLDFGVGRLVTNQAYCRFSTINDSGTGGAHIAFMPQGNVGIGNQTPLEQLDVNGSVSVGNQSSIGGYVTRISSAETASILEQKSTASASAGPGIVLGFTGNTGVHTSVLVVRGTGNVGIGTREPGYQLQLSQDSAAKPTSNTWTVVSDSRLKKDILPFTDGLNTVVQINPVKYKLNGKAGLPDNAEGISVIGQEIEKIAPYTVKKFKAKLEPADKEETELLSFDSSPLVFVMINAIKEQETRLEKLETELNKLEN